MGWLDQLISGGTASRDSGGLLAQLASQPTAELRAYTPPLRQRVLDYLIGDTRPTYAKSNFMKGLVGLADFTPMGAAFALDDAQRSMQAGDQQGAQLAVLGAIPGFRPAGKAAQTVARAAEREIPQGIRAYHGSPHDFDKFDITKIGTGEGAQSYGHGLYFAENPSVALDYKNRLSPTKSNYSAVNKRDADQWLNEAGGDRDLAIKRLDAFLLQTEDPSLRAQISNAANILRGKDYSPGRMYEVNINARPEKFLDWDKPFSQQAATVQGAVTQSPMWTAPLTDAPDNLMRNILRDPRSTAQLSEAGIPGIRYLDQGSRNISPSLAQKHLDMVLSMGPSKYSSPEEYAQVLATARSELQKATSPTHNYVVFNDTLIDILRKYGLAGAAATGAATFAAPQTQDVY